MTGPFETSHRLDQLPALPLGTEVSVSGWIAEKRVLGKLTVAQLSSAAGAVQVLVMRDKVDGGVDSYRIFRKEVQPGDVVGVRGPLILTMKGTLSVQVVEWARLAGAPSP